MTKPRIIFYLGNRAASYAISAVIITSVTVALVLVASMFAYQVLEQQRGMTEFDVAKDSILAFDDALQNVAWKPDASRSVRFTAKYGGLELIPNGAVLIVNTTVEGVNRTVYSGGMGFVKYYIPTKYVNFGQGYQEYILGNASLLVAKNTESYGRAVVEQASNYVTATLNYRVRTMRTSVTMVSGTKVNYVEIWVIKVSIPQFLSYAYDFDLKARCLNVTSTSWGPYDVGSSCTVSAQFGSGSQPSSATISLDPGQVVFNVVVSEVRVAV